MTAIDAQLPASVPAAGQDPPEYEPGDCVSCGQPTRAGAPLARIGDQTGPACDDCAYWCDGNLDENLIAGVVYDDDGYEVDESEGCTCCQVHSYDDREPDDECSRGGRPYGRHDGHA